MTGQVLALWVGVTALMACEGNRGRSVDRDLVAYIDGIKAIDAHAHPLRYVADGAPKDSEFDALPLDGIPTFPVPLGLRPDEPRYRAAQHALVNVSLTDTGAAFPTPLAPAGPAARREHAG